LLKNEKNGVGRMFDRVTRTACRLPAKGPVVGAFSTSSEAMTSLPVQLQIMVYRDARRLLLDDGVSAGESRRIGCTLELSLGQHHAERIDRHGGGAEHQRQGRCDEDQRVAALVLPQPPPAREGDAGGSTAR
jgi:hypothetical protein